MSQRSFDRTLWAAQWILACAFELIGMIKLGLSVHHVRPHFGLPPDATTGMLHAVGAAEALLAMAIVVPGITRVCSRLCVVSAGALGVVAIVGSFRPESAVSSGIIALNLVLAALAAFVVWGRLIRSPFEPFSEKEAELPGCDDAIWFTQ